jgi:hypothetical protein
MTVQCNICNVISSATINLYLHLMNIEANEVFGIAKKHVYLKLKYTIALYIISVIFNPWGDSYNSIIKLIL